MASLSSKPKAPPPVQPPAPMPDEEELEKARRKKALEQKSRSGRQSTILSDTSETLG